MTEWVQVEAIFQLRYVCSAPVAWNQVLMQGGRIGLSSGLGRVLADVQQLRPTVFAAPPTFWNGLFKDFENQVARSGPDARH